MHQYGMFLPLSPLCIPVFIVCQTQCSTPVHHVCISVTSRFFQVFHTPLFWRSGIATRFCCPASNPAVPSCLYLFIGVVTSFTINTNFAVWILGMHFYWDRGSTSFLFFSFLEKERLRHTERHGEREGEKVPWIRGWQRSPRAFNSEFLTYVLLWTKSKYLHNGTQVKDSFNSSLSISL